MIRGGGMRGRRGGSSWRGVEMREGGRGFGGLAMDFSDGEGGVFLEILVINELVRFW